MISLPRNDFSRGHCRDRVIVGGAVIARPIEQNVDLASAEGGVLDVHLQIKQFLHLKAEQVVIPGRKIGQPIFSDCERPNLHRGQTRNDECWNSVIPALRAASSRP